ncbi:unnamed protein product [Lampetra planeri]
MASAAPAENVDRELTCSICLDTFDCPSTLTCGHSFCLLCLEDAWKETDSYCCPQCRKTFPRRPQLTRNVTIANLIEQLRVTETMAAAATAGVVFCDHCPEGKTLAVKTCLRCETSFCREHLVPHLENRKFKGHVLVSPDVNPEERKCKRHKEELKFYCKQDVSLVCTVCAFTGEHRGHDVDTLEDEHQTRKLVICLSPLQTEAESLAENWCFSLSEYSRLASLTALLNLFFDSLNLSLSPLLNASSFSNLNFLSFAENQGLLLLLKFTLVRVGIQQSSQKLMYNVTASVNGRSPTLDPNSAHNILQISSDLRTVTRTAVSQGRPDHPHRFDVWLQALCSESFSSGQHYWEVDVGGVTGFCQVGVAYGTIARKGLGNECSLGRNDSSWVLYKRNNSCYVCHGGVLTSVPVRDLPPRVGCHLNWEAGLLSFYCADSMELLHSIHHSFSQPLYPALRVWGVGDSVRILDLSRAS